MGSGAIHELKFGCQTFIWEMAGKPYPHPKDMVKAIANAGYTGVEITDNLIGPYFDDGDGFRTLLDDHGLALVAFTISTPSGFTVPEKKPDDLDHIARSLSFLQAFPDAYLTLGSATRVNDDDPDRLFATAAEIYNEAGDLSADAAHRLCVHASSHDNTILLTEADYCRILDATNPDTVRWVPDTGHMLKVGQDLMKMVAQYRNRIGYVHLKDVDAGGAWAMLGEGVMQVRALADLLGLQQGGDLWFVVEEESAVSQRNRDAALLADLRALEAACLPR